MLDGKLVQYVSFSYPISIGTDRQDGLDHVLPASQLKLSSKMCEKMLQVCEQNMYRSFARSLGSIGEVDLPHITQS